MEGFRPKKEKEFVCLVLVRMRSCPWHISLAGNSLGSLSNLDDDGNKNPTNLHIWQWKTVFLHALRVHFSSFDILKTFSFFLRREMTCFAVVWTTWADDDKCSIWSSYICPKRWFQFNSRIVRTHFSSKMTLNNCEIIAETGSYIFRWRSRFSRRRVCLSSLIALFGRRSCQLFKRPLPWKLLLENWSQIHIFCCCCCSWKVLFAIYFATRYLCFSWRWQKVSIKNVVCVTFQTKRVFKPNHWCKFRVGF